VTAFQDDCNHWHTSETFLSVYIISPCCATTRGKTLSAVAETLNVTNTTVGHWRDSYNQIGLACLHDQARSGRPIEIAGSQRAKVTALACSEPPAGYGRWTLRLLADKAVELGYSEHLSHTKVSEILKKTT
jgi:putative transposase